MDDKQGIDTHVYVSRPRLLSGTAGAGGKKIMIRVEVGYYPMGNSEESPCNEEIFKKKKNLADILNYQFLKGGLPT